MFARVLGLATVLIPINLGISALLFTSEAMAVSVGNAGFSVPAKRQQFRPVPNAAHSDAVSRSAAEFRGGDASRRSGLLGRGNPPLTSKQRDLSGLVFGSRSGARKASPVTRGQELGLRFRPDDRDPSYAQPVPAPGRADAPFGTVEGGESAQFRPTERRRRATYEELEAAAAANNPYPNFAPALPYPALPPPLLPGQGMGRGFPRW